MGTLWQKPVCPWPPKCPCSFSVLCGYCMAFTMDTVQVPMGCVSTLIFLGCIRLTVATVQTCSCPSGTADVDATVLGELLEGCCLFLPLLQWREGFASPTKDDWEGGRKMYVLIALPNTWNRSLNWKWKYEASCNWIIPGECAGKHKDLERVLSGEGAMCWCVLTWIHAAYELPLSQLASGSCRSTSL